MAVTDEDRTYLFTRIAEAIDDRAARTMSELFEGLEFRIDATFDGFRHQMEGLLHREIGAAIASQTRTVLVGILAVTASMFAMLLAMNQLL